MKIEGIEVRCDACGKDLLRPPSGIYAMPETKDRTHLVYFACKGKCDKKLQEQYGWGGWSDLKDLFVPEEYIRRQMSFMNGLRAGDKYEEESWKKVRAMFMGAFVSVARESTKEEQERAEALRNMPDGL